MTYEEYLKIETELENQLKKLKADYLEEHGLAIGTPVIFLGKNDGWKHRGIGELHHIYQRRIGWKGEVEHNILPAKKDGTPSKKGAYIYFCEKKDLQVVTNDDH
jgi:hypothetical protein